MITLGLNIAVFVCWILAAVCNAVMDILAHKYKQSIFSKWNRQYWDPSVSHRNKYKNHVISKEPKFFGSTTFLVFLTDGWHLFQFLSNSFIIVSIILIINCIADVTWWQNLALFIMFKVLWGVFFEWFYSKLLRL